MAAPHLAGIARLVKSQNPNFTHLQIRDAILNGADTKGSFTNKVATGGRVNAYKAICSLSPPKNVLETLEESDSTVSLSWDPNTKDNGLTGYIVSYTTGPAYTYQVQLENATSCTIVGLQNGITYNFAGRAFAHFPAIGVKEGPNSVIGTVTPVVFITEILMVTRMLMGKTLRILY